MTQIGDTPLMPLQRCLKSITSVLPSFLRWFVERAPQGRSTLCPSRHRFQRLGNPSWSLFTKNILFHSFPKSMLLHIFFTQSKCFSQKSLTFCAFLFCDHISLRPLQTHFQLSVVHFLRRYSSTVNKYAEMIMQPSEIKFKFSRLL